HRAADSETKKAIEELRSQMADEIVQAVEATLKEKLDMKKHVKLIDNALKKVVLNRTATSWHSGTPRRFSPWGSRKAWPSWSSTGKICPLLEASLKSLPNWCGSSISPSSASPKSRRFCRRF